MNNAEIKFRVWDGKEMIFVSKMEFHNAPDRFTIDNVIASRYEKWPIMQFINRHDKNNVEIYPGDIIEYEGWHGSVGHTIDDINAKEKGLPPIDYTERRVVLQHPWGHFILRKVDDISDYTYVGDWITFGPEVTKKEWKIIGNIYQHPHLLTDKR